MRPLRQRLARRDGEALRSAAEAALGVPARAVLTDVSAETDEPAYVFALAGAQASGPRSADRGAAAGRQGGPAKKQAEKKRKNSR